MTTPHFLSPGKPIAVSLIPSLQPPSQSTLLHWFDFSDIISVWADTAATIQITDATAIRRIDNKGTDGTFLTSASAGASPIYRVGTFNGENIADYTFSRSLNAVIASGLTVTSTGMTMAAIARWNVSVAAANPVLEWGVSHTIDWMPGPPERARIVMPGTTSLDMVPIALMDNWYLMYGSVDQSGSTDDAIFGSPGSEDTTSISSVNTDVANGATMSLDSANWDQELAEAFIWSGPLSLSDRAALVTYANAKYGILPHT